MTLIITLVIAIVVFNITATITVLRPGSLSRNQRIAQIMLVWLIPVIGAVICLAVTASQIREIPPTRKHDPLHLPSDGGAPDGASIGICGCGGDSSGDGGGD